MLKGLAEKRVCSKGCCWKRKLSQRQLDRKFGLTDQEKNFISRQFDPDLLGKALDETLFANSKKVVLRHLEELSEKCGN